jgi:hypothetical protein
MNLFSAVPALTGLASSQQGIAEKKMRQGQPRVDDDAWLPYAVLLWAEETRME